MWDLATRLNGQIRAMPGVVLGFDMTAALAMARALGIDEMAVAEFLPAVEVGMVQQMNKRAGDGN